MFDQYVRNEYRNDIQGLRAVGAIIIMFFHIWFHKVSGGVDVFFVISGFLMSSIILKNFFLDSIINPVPFWGGIIKRIAPSAYVVLAVTFLASYFIYSPNYLDRIVREVGASALHLENLALIRYSVDYLASKEFSSPVQQFWALSIQIQFYIILPIVLIPLAYITKKTGNSVLIFIIVSLLIISSFSYAIVSVRENAAASYFNPLSRLWEFFFGVLSYLIVSNLKNIRYRDFLGFLGLFLIISGAVFIPRGAGFPGFVSLTPVLGAVFIIISGASGSGLINTILSNKILVFLGGISFTIYLWHWPILVLYKEYYNYKSVGFIQGLAIMLASIFLAYFTNRYIESPFKNIPRREVLKNFSIGLIFFLPVIISVFLTKYNIDKNINISIANFDGNLIEPFSKEQIFLENKPEYFDRKKILLIGKIIPDSYNIGCNQEGDAYEAKTCSFGDLKSKKSIILVGSSHATQWLPALDEIGKRNNFKVINMTKSSCPLGALESSDSSCHKWNEKVFDEILDINPYAVITNSTLTSAKDKEFIPESFVESWSRLDAKGINVIGIRDNPRFSYNVPDCVYKNRNLLDLESCAINKEDALLRKNPANNYSHIIGNIDMSNMFCAQGKCLTRFQGKIIYRDSNHISVEYMYFIQNNLEKKLKELIMLPYE